MTLRSLPIMLTGSPNMAMNLLKMALLKSIAVLSCWLVKLEVKTTDSWPDFHRSYIFCTISAVVDAKRDSFIKQMNRIHSMLRCASSVRYQGEGWPNSPSSSYLVIVMACTSKHTNGIHHINSKEFKDYWIGSRNQMRDRYKQALPYIFVVILATVRLPCFTA